MEREGDRVGVCVCYVKRRGTSYMKAREKRTEQVCVLAISKKEREIECLRMCVCYVKGKRERERDNVCVCRLWKER